MIKHMRKIFHREFKKNKENTMQKPKRKKTQKSQSCHFGEPKIGGQNTNAPQDKKNCHKCRKKCNYAKLG